MLICASFFYFDEYLWLLAIYLCSNIGMLIGLKEHFELGYGAPTLLLKVVNYECFMLYFESGIERNQ